MISASWALLWSQEVYLIPLFYTYRWSRKKTIPNREVNAGTDLFMYLVQLLLVSVAHDFSMGFHIYTEEVLRLISLLYVAFMRHAPIRIILNEIDVSDHEEQQFIMRMLLWVVELFIWKFPSNVALFHFATAIWMLLLWAISGKTDRTLLKLKQVWLTLFYWTAYFALCFIKGVPFGVILVYCFFSLLCGITVIYLRKRRQNRDEETMHFGMAPKASLSCAVYFNSKYSIAGIFLSVFSSVIYSAYEISRHSNVLSRTVTESVSIQIFLRTTISASAILISVGHLNKKTKKQNNNRTPTSFLSMEDSPDAAKVL